MEQSVSQRLMRYLEFKGIRIGRAEKDLGLSNGYIKKLKGSPSAEKLDLILTAYIDLSRNWLLYGTGNMLKEGYTTFEPVGVVGQGASTPTSQGASNLENEMKILQAEIELKDKLIASLQEEVNVLRDMNRQMLQAITKSMESQAQQKNT